MERAIDASELMAEIQVCSWDSEQDRERAEDLVLGMPTLTPPNEWVSVEERLPEKKQDVLMLFKSGNMAVGWWHDVDEHVTFWCAYTDDGFYTDCDDMPVYWMHLANSRLAHASAIRAIVRFGNFHSGRWANQKSLLVDFCVLVILAIFTAHHLRNVGGGDIHKLEYAILKNLYCSFVVFFFAIATIVFKFLNSYRPLNVLLHSFSLRSAASASSRVRKTVFPITSFQ